MGRLSLTFFNGASTVGGVQVLAAGGSGKVLFDLGVVGNPAIVRSSVLFHDFTAPAPGRELYCYLRAGMAPPVDRLYDERLLGEDVATIAERNASAGPRCARLPHVSDFEPGRDRVFVSHLHDDHARLLPFLAEEVTVLMSAESAALHSAQAAAGLSEPTRAAVEALLPGEERSLGDLTVEAVPVDHDIPGASGLYVRTPSTSLLYTGDWRLHGAHPELMEAVLERYAGEVDVLVTEASTAGNRGVGAAYPEPLQEAEVTDRFGKILADVEGVVYCTFHEQNVERQVRIAEAAEAAGRHLVVHPRTHALWSALAERGVVALDGLPRHVWGPGPGSGEEVAAVAAPAPFAEVSEAEVRAERNRFVCEVRVEDRWRLLDTEAGAADCYVHMNGSPFSTADPGWPALVTWLSELGTELVVVSSHGHATPEALSRFAERLRPRLLIPVHSNDPGAFPTSVVPVRTVARGEVVRVG